MSKRIKALFLAMIMIASMVLVDMPAVHASVTDNGLSISAQEVHPGSEFTVSAWIPKLNVTGYSMQGKVQFDNKAFELIEYTAPTPSGAMGSVSSLTKANENGKFAFSFISTEGFSLAEGYCAVAKFKVKENVTGTKNFVIEKLMAYDNASPGQPLYDATTETTASVNVTIPATKVSLNKTELTLVEGNTETLTSTKTPGNTTDNVVWKSDNEQVATVDENGKVTAVAPGKAVITATAGVVSATCNVTVTCAHANTTEHKAVESTCTEKGHAAYTVCNDCKEVIEGSADELPLAAHQLNHVEEKAPECEVNGNREYWQCTECKKFFGDSQAEKELIEQETVITAPGHNSLGEWETDPEKHWKPCGGCGNIFTFEEGKHEYAEQMLYNADEHWDACTVCGYVTNQAQHTGGKANCSEKATCEDCGQPYGEFGSHSYAENPEQKYLAKGATCTEKAIYKKSCSVCGEAHATETFEYGDALGHDYSETWSYSETEHWHECTVCKDKKDKSEHTGGSATCLEKATCTICNAEYSDKANCVYEEVVGERYLVSAATCTEPAVYQKSCKVCKEPHATETFKYGEALGHNYKEVAEVPAKCEEAGTKEHYDCSRCDSISLDKVAECKEADLVISATGHSDGNVVEEEYLVSAATCTKKAVYNQSCTVCGRKNEAETFESGEALGHDYKEIPEVPAKCEEAGTKKYYDCSRCDSISLDKVAECKEADLVISATGHGDGNVVDEKYLVSAATCTKKAVYNQSCTVCGRKNEAETFESGEALGHDYKEIPKVPAKCEEAGTKKYYDCSRCDSISLDKVAECTKADLVIPATDHKYGEVVDEKYLVSEATCVAKAIYNESCIACGKVGTTTFETGTVDAENHTGNTEVRNAKDAKCYEVGYTGDTYCKDCEAKLLSGETIAKLPHNITSWVVTKEPTTEETGEKTGYCANKEAGCTEEHKVIIEKLVASGDTVKQEVIENTSVKEEEKITVESVVVSKDSNVNESVVLQVENVTNSISKTEEEAIEKAVGKSQSLTKDHKLATILDIKMILREKTEQGDIIADTEFELEGEVQIKLQIPESLVKNYENIVLLHIKDDGSVEVVPYTMGDNNTITFNADGFSYYAFAGTQKVVSDNITNQPGTDKPGDTSPETGDKALIALWSALLVCGLFAVVVLLVKRYKKKF